MRSSGPSREDTNDMSIGSSGSSRLETNSMSLNINQDKSHHHQAGDKTKENICDDWLPSGHDFDFTVDGEDELSLYSKEVD